MENEKIELGDKVKDKITKKTGIVIARTEWISGRDTISVVPDYATGFNEANVFEENLLEVVEKGFVKI